ncbi:MAG: flavin reductase family protein [Planctomycetaceae bacterium]
MLRVIVPRPIAWVSTMSPESVANVAPFSFFTGVGSRPPSVLFCPANRPDGLRKDTLRNIERTGEFVVNVVPCALVEQMNASSAELAASESEFAHCGLTPIDSRRVAVPRVAESPVQLECKLMQSIHIGTGPGGANVVIGHVVHLHIDDAIIDTKGLVDQDLLDAVGRMGGVSYCRTRDRFDVPRPD